MFNGDIIDNEHFDNYTLDLLLKSDWSRAFNEHKVACKVGMINAVHTVWHTICK